MDPIDSAMAVARRFVADRHPEARAAALAGSVAAGRATATSDLDIVVFYADRPASFAETVEYDGWLIESFVYDENSLTEWFDRDIEERRPVALDMWANGIALSDDPMGAVIRERARQLLSEGSGVLPAQESADLRYALSAAVDDLQGSSDPAERYAIEADVFVRAGSLLLVSNGRWLGTGKWLVRRLEQYDDTIAHELVEWARASDRDTSRLLRLADEVLTRCGGRLQAGHTRGAPQRS